MNLFGRIRLTIRYKMLLSFTLVIFIGLLSLLLVSVKITEQNVSRLIDRDMVQTKKTVDLYLKQYFLTRNMFLSAGSFHTEADGLVKELGSAVGSTVSIYDSKGKSLSDLNGPIPDTSDFSGALQGGISYVVSQSGADSTISLSSPVLANGAVIGVVRVVKDNAALHDFTNRFLFAVKWIAAAIFALVFITAVFLSSRLTGPIGRLSGSLKDFSNGRYEPLPFNRRTDEIGDLARAFHRMAEKIEEQMDVIKRERDTLLKTQKMSKTFFDNVTHELKTPLTIISGYAQTMRENGFHDKPFFDKGIKYIMDESRRLNDKVVQILEMSTAASRQTDYRYEQVNLPALVREVCTDMTVKARKYKIDIRCETGADFNYRGDREKLREMLINVVDNAVKYGGVDSTVTVSLKKTDTGKVTICVSDQGKGIAEEHIEHVFEPFYRVSGESQERERGSAGLGLALVKAIAEKHGGSVKLASTRSAGTQVIIEMGEG